MKATYENAPHAVYESVREMINKFPNKFLHINLVDLCIMFKDDPRPKKKASWTARTRVLNGLYRTLIDKKILMEIDKQEWETSDAATKSVTLYRELLRVGLNDKTQEYVLMKPDVTDFYEVLSKLGLNYENASEFFGLKGQKNGDVSKVS